MGRNYRNNGPTSHTTIIKPPPEWKRKRRRKPNGAPGQTPKDYSLRRRLNAAAKEMQRRAASDAEAMTEAFREKDTARRLARRELEDQARGGGSTPSNS